jgi:hypothetical protein
MGAALLFSLHDDIRHVVVVDASGNVVSIGSRAKTAWSEDIIKRFSGLMAAVIFGICEKVQDIAGYLNHIQIDYEKMRVFIVRRKEKIYIISTRKNIPREAVNKMIELVGKL